MDTNIIILLVIAILSIMCIYILNKYVEISKLIDRDFNIIENELRNFEEEFKQTSDLTDDQYHHVKLGIKLSANKIKSAHMPISSELKKYINNKF